MRTAEVTPCCFFAKFEDSRTTCTPAGEGTTTSAEGFPSQSLLGATTFVGPPGVVDGIGMRGKLCDGVEAGVGEGRGAIGTPEFARTRRGGRFSGSRQPFRCQRIHSLTRPVVVIGWKPCKPQEKNYDGYASRDRARSSLETAHHTTRTLDDVLVRSDGCGEALSHMDTTDGFKSTCCAIDCCVSSARRTTSENPAGFQSNRKSMLCAQ